MKVVVMASSRLDRNAVKVLGQEASKAKKFFDGDLKISDSSIVIENATDSDYMRLRPLMIQVNKDCSTDLTIQKRY